MAMPIDPEAQGRLMAEALVQGLENLKSDFAGPSLESQLAAGQAAVEAMKQLLGGITRDLPG
jgi:hypothetical protein